MSDDALECDGPASLWPHVSIASVIAIHISLLRSEE
jgi:hypothetical protein